MFVTRHTLQQREESWRLDEEARTSSGGGKGSSSSSRSSTSSGLPSRSSILLDHQPRPTNGFHHEHEGEEEEESNEEDSEGSGGSEGGRGGGTEDAGEDAAAGAMGTSPNLAEVDEEMQGGMLCSSSVSASANAIAEDEVSTSGSASGGGSSEGNIGGIGEGGSHDLEVHNYAAEEVEEWKKSREDEANDSGIKEHGSGSDLSSTWRVMLMSYSSFCPRESVRQETEEKLDETKDKERQATASNDSQATTPSNVGNSRSVREGSQRQVAQPEQSTQRAMRELTDKFPARTTTMERFARDKIRRQTVILESIGSLVAAGREEVGQAKATNNNKDELGQGGAGEVAAPRQPVFDYEKILETGRWWQLLSEGSGSDQLMELCLALAKANPGDAVDHESTTSSVVQKSGGEGRRKKKEKKDEKKDNARNRAMSNEALEISIVSVANASLITNEVDSGQIEAEEEQRRAEQASAEQKRAEEEDADEALGSFVLFYSYHKKAEHVLKNQGEWPFVSQQLCQLLLTHTHCLVSNRSTNSGERLMTALLAMDVLMNHDSNRQLLAQSQAIPVFMKILRRRSAHLPLLIAVLQCINTICSNDLARSDLAKPDEVQLIVQTANLYRDDFRTQQLCCAIINQLASSESHREVVAKSGTVSLLLRALKNNPRDSVLLDSCTALHRLSFKNNLRKIIVGEGGIDTLMRLLYLSNTFRMRKTSAILEQTVGPLCGAIRNLAIEKDNRIFIFRKDGINGVLMAMKLSADNADLLENTCAILANLSFNDELRNAMDNRVIKEVLHTMESHRDACNIQIQALSVLWNLSVKDENKKAIGMAKQPGLGTIVRALKLHPDNSKVLEKCCGLLWNLTILSPNQLKIAKIGGIEALLTIMANQREVALLQRLACGAMQNLAANDENKSKIIRKDGVSTVLKLMELHPHDPLVMQRTCAVIANLASGTAPNPATANSYRAHIISKGAVPLIVQVMTSCSDSQCVQAQGCKAIRNLAEDPKNKMYLLEQGCSFALLSALEKFGPSLQSLRNDATIALRNLNVENADTSGV